MNNLQDLFSQSEVAILAGCPSLLGRPLNCFLVFLGKTQLEVRIGDSEVQAE